MALELRPTFTVDLPESCAVVTERLRAALAASALITKWARLPGARPEQASEGTFVLIAPSENEQKLFSPWLHLSINRTETGTQLFGRFSPRPAVWTAFAMAYLFLACVMFFSAMVGVSMTMLNQPAWPLWITGGAAALLAGLYVASQTGQRLAARQMEGIRGVIDQAIRKESRKT
jgi:hypothetical protein